MMIVYTPNVAAATFVEVPAVKHTSGPVVFLLVPLDQVPRFGTVAPTPAPLPPARAEEEEAYSYYSDSPPPSPSAVPRPDRRCDSRSRTPPGPRSSCAARLTPAPARPASPPTPTAPVPRAPTRRRGGRNRRGGQRVRERRQRAAAAAARASSLPTECPLTAFSEAARPSPFTQVPTSPSPFTSTSTSSPFPSGPQLLPPWSATGPQPRGQLSAPVPGSLPPWRPPRL